jgi:hypothetical protein
MTLRLRYLTLKLRAPCWLLRRRHTLKGHPMKRISIAVFAALMLATPAMALDRHCRDVLQRTERDGVAGPDDTACFEKMTMERFMESDRADCAKYSTLKTFRKIYGQEALTEIGARGAVEASDYGLRMKKIYYDDCVAFQKQFEK